MPRQARLDTLGTLHHVIIRGIEKSPIVDDVKDNKEFVFRMGALSTEGSAGWGRAELIH